MEDKMLKKAIFDMDGLIFDTERLFMKELSAAMAQEGYTLTEDIYTQTIGLASDEVNKKMCGIYGNDYPFEKMSARARSQMEKNALGGLPVKDGIRELLGTLRAKGIECCVASSTEAEFVKKYINAAGLGEYFGEIIGGDMAPRSKPAPDIFIKALGSTPPNEAVVFEDSENGVRAGISAGIPVICIPDMKRPPEEVLSKVYACVNSAYDAVPLMEEM